MADVPSATHRTMSQRIRSLLRRAPWVAAASLARLFYGFRVYGEEHIPEEGPYIVALNEQSAIAMLVSGYISIMLLRKAREKTPEHTVAYMQEELWAFSYFRKAFASRPTGTYRPLVPHSAGMLGLGLLDGYRALQHGGIVVMNPEGDATWDGRPVPHAPGLAWLALHTAAPVVPMLTNIGFYDVWPRWLGAPSGRGRLKLTVGQPFRLCDAPLDEVTPEEVEAGRARVQAAFEPLAYGPGGVKEWAGPITLNGAPLEAPPELRPPEAVVAPTPEAGAEAVPVYKLGVVQLLWQCPMCHTNEALAHERVRFRKRPVTCQACGTRWELRRVPARDFRLKVVAGAPELIGLEMGLSTWYDQMKLGFRTAPISVSGAELLPGEEVHLEKSRVTLSPYRPNPLFDGWTGREPPRALSRGRREYADWGSIGEGRLLLTSHRLLWQGEQGELDFFWSSVNAVYLWMYSTIIVNYGSASYRFALGEELGLKWLYHAGTLAKRQGEIDGHRVTMSYC